MYIYNIYILYIICIYMYVYIYVCIHIFIPDGLYQDHEFEKHDLFTLFTCTLFFKYIFYGVNLPVYLFIWQADAVEIVHMQKIFQLYFECIFYSGVLVVFHFTFILLPFLLQILRATFYIGFYCYIMCHSCFHYFSSLEIFLR